MEGEAANLGFAASIDTGVSVAGTPVKANFQCEQFTFFNRNTEFNYNNWCSRNSKLGLSGPWGEVMFSGWLTPYNEVTAQWIDPFYDAGSHTHSTLLGNVGFGVNYGNSGFDAPDTGYGDGIGGQGFMRRKSNLYQWFSPNWGGLAMRVGWSNTNQFSAEDTRPTGTDFELDPTILSVGIAYTTTINETDELWLGFGYQEHDEFAAVSLTCEDSNDETMRFAARYIHDWGNGHSTRLSWAYEEMEYDWDNCTKDLVADEDGKPKTTGLQGGAGPFAYHLTGGVVDFERDAWLVSGKHDFPGPLDFRFMYMEADDFDCGANMGVDGVSNCAGISENSSGAEAFSVGLYYTLPAGTELRMVYGEVDNDRNSANGFGISSAAGGPAIQGGTEESLQFGVVQWF